MNVKLKLGIIGLGARGSSLLKYVVLPMCEDNIELVSLCDVYEDRVNAAAEEAEKVLGKRPFATTDSEKALTTGIDAVLISAAWESHIDLAISAMRKGIYTGLEVGGAYSVEDCFRLVRTYEETGTHCMLLENCCYGKRELMALNMVRMGVLGDIVHCSGGYHHDLREEVAGGKDNRHYRLRNYINRCCENYPTHELGPIAKLLGINNGNRMLTLTSTASSAKGLHEYCLATKGAEHPLSKIAFSQGDVVTTVIKCAGGQTITLTLDTTLPRAYSRAFTVRGTKGAYFGETDSVFIDGEHNQFDFCPEKLWGNAKKYEDTYLDRLWRDYVPKGGHDGMDWLVFSAFVESALTGKRPPIDVYDAAAYMVITPLSEESIFRGGVPVAVPDFTNGKWYRRSDICDGYYSLDVSGVNKDFV